MPAYTDYKIFGNAQVKHYVSYETRKVTKICVDIALLSPPADSKSTTGISYREIEPFSQMDFYDDFLEIFVKQLGDILSTRIEEKEQSAKCYVSLHKVIHERLHCKCWHAIYWDPTRPANLELDKKRFLLLAAFTWSPELEKLYCGRQINKTRNKKELMSCPKLGGNKGLCTYHHHKSFGTLTGSKWFKNSKPYSYKTTPSENLKVKVLSKGVDNQSKLEFLSSPTSTKLIEPKIPTPVVSPKEELVPTTKLIEPKMSMGIPRPFGMSRSGTPSSSAIRFDPSRHRVRAEITGGSDTMQLVEEIEEIEKIEKIEKIEEVEEVEEKDPVEPKVVSPKREDPVEPKKMSKTRTKKVKKPKKKHGKTGKRGKN